MNDRNRLKRNLNEEGNGFADQQTVSFWRNELKKSQAAIVQLKSDNLEDAQNENLECNIDKGLQNDKSYQGNDEFNELLKLLFHKESVIERMSSDIQMLEIQLKEAVSAKVNALARLEHFEKKERNMLFNAKQTQIVNEPADWQGSSISKEAAPIQYAMEDGQKKPHEKDRTVNSRFSNQRKRFRKDNPIMAPVAEDDDDDDAHNVHMRSTSSECDEKSTTVDIASDENDEGLSRHLGNEDVPSNMNIQLELLSEARTRRQNQFVRDAFGESGRRSEDLSTRNDKKVHVTEQASSWNKITLTPGRFRAVVEINKLKFDK